MPTIGQEIAATLTQQLMCKHISRSTAGPFASDESGGRDAAGNTAQEAQDRLCKRLRQCRASEPRLGAVQSLLHVEKVHE